MVKEFNGWKVGVDYPEFYKERSLLTISKGYLQENETPKMLYKRVADAAASRLQKPELAEDFFTLMWNGWLGLASPVASNMGTERGMPISCFSLNVPDSVSGIYSSVHELAMLTKAGGGVGIYAGDIRGRGKLIRGNGVSEGVVPWLKVFDSAILATNQGNVRRGAAAAYLDIDHLDIDEFLRIRRPEGDINRQCLNLHQGVCVSDDFMKRVKRGDEQARELWIEILKSRFETGEPYILFKDNANKNNPQAYINNNLRVETSNICSEIMLHTDKDHSFVCCLSSLNLAMWDEWKDWHSSRGMSVPYLSAMFLDGVIQEFIDKGRGQPGLERAIRSAEKGRAVGIGVMGWHSYLQSIQEPIDGLQAMFKNKIIFKFIKEEAEKASQDMAQEYGEPEWCKGTGMRNTHLIALAPTVSNSTICGGVSPSIEPWVANAFNQKSAKGTFLVKNEALDKVLSDLGQNTKDVWKSIVDYNGSVQHLEFLSDDQKAVFKTARELDQSVLIKLAADRQPMIDQAQSLNLFYPLPTTEDDKKLLVKKIHKDHFLAWESGVKTLYYMRTGSILKANFKEVLEQDCSSCEG
jgi:ribonucleoside-diphosphate reductase alpha chain